MHTRPRCVAAFLTMTLWLVGAGCASVQPIEAPLNTMTVREAKRSLVESLNDLHYCTPARDVKFTRQRVHFKVDNIIDAARPKTLDFALTFAELTNLTLRSRSHDFHQVDSKGRCVLLMPGENTYYSKSFRTERAARMFADALLTLREAASAPDNEEADFAAFNAGVTTWFAAEPKPPMSDDTRASKAMAEDAFKRKDFAAALDAYVEALGKHPMWPEGHYNAALLAAECEDFGLAARHMRRYLALAPDAKDAAAAKDKYLLWQRKAKE